MWSIERSEDSSKFWPNYASAELQRVQYNWLVNITLQWLPWVRLKWH